MPKAQSISFLPLPDRPTARALRAVSPLCEVTSERG
jgi:hypothetical protein